MNRNLKICYVANLIFSLGLGIHQQFMPLHLRNLGADAIALGQYSAIGLLASSLAYFPTTWLCNRFDRKWLIFWGWAVAIPIPLVYAFAPSWQWCLAASVVYNASLFTNVALQNYTIKNSPPERITANLSTVFAAFSLGNLFSQPLGGWLVDQVGFTWIFLIAAAFYALSTFLYLFIEADPPLESERDAPAINLRLPRRHALLLLSFCVIHAINILPMEFIVPFINDHSQLSLFWIGLIGSAASFAGAFFSPQLGRIADRWSIFHALGINAALAAASFLLLIAFPDLLPMLLLASLLRGTLKTTSLHTASLGKIARPEERSNLLSLFGFSAGLMAMIGPMISGVLYELQPRYPFLLAAALNILILVLILSRLGALKAYAAPAAVAAAEETDLPRIEAAAKDD